MPERGGAGPRGWLRRLEGYFGRAGLIAFVLGVALIAGQQIFQPDKRVIQVVAAALIVLLAFRFRSIEGLMLAVLFLPFPKGTSYGNTNVAFVLLIAIVWLFRVTTRRVPPPTRTPLDLPILGLIMAYCISFYNVDPPSNYPVAWSIFLGFLTYLLIFYMVVHIIQSREDVQKILLVQTISCAIVCLLAIYEQGHPGAALIPGWIEFGATAGLARGDVRVGSTFLDYELFGEYCALNLFLQMFLWTRVTTRSRRFALGSVMALTFFCLFSTVTRGALLSFLVGTVYLIWLSRRRMNFVRLVMVVSLASAAILGGDFVVSHFTRSYSVLDRLFGTKLEKGLPDTRSQVWRESVEHIAEHPFIGHGPFYAARSGVKLIYWPHNVYLYYAHIVGLVGLAFYLYLLFILWKWTRPRAPSLGSGSFMEGATLVARVMLFTFMFDQIKIDYLRNTRYSFFVWFFFGLLLAIGMVAAREAKTRAAGETAPVRAGGEASVPGPRTRRLPAVSARPAVAGR